MRVDKMADKEAEKGIIEVYESCGMTFWQKKGDVCANRNIIELVKLIKEGWEVKIK
jgi:hypothetical protein